MSFSQVNLLWQQRFRGLMPVTAHNVGDGGRTILLRPDEFEPRTYQVLAVDANGSATEVSAVHVERIRKFDVATDASVLLGLTTDDLYLFRDGRKTRLMPEREAVYEDACLAAPAGLLACGFSNALHASHTLALADASGRIVWTKELPEPVACVGISCSGEALGAALQDGQILLFDARRRPVWAAALDAMPRCLQFAGSGSACVAGTDQGDVTLLRADGSLGWRSAVGMPLIALAADAALRITAAALSDATTHRLTCLGPDGSPLWEYDLDAVATGASLSPGGRHLVVSMADGTVSCFELAFSDSRTFALGPVRRGTAAASDGPRAERDALAAHLQEHAHDLAAADRLAEIEQRLVEEYRAGARDLLDRGRPLTALELLDAAAELAPADEELFRERLRARDAAVARERSRAESLEAGGDRSAARAAWVEVLKLDRTVREAREALGRLRRAEADELVAAGAEREQGDLAGALRLWREAHVIHPNEELEGRLRDGELRLALETGMAYYQAGRLPEAAFQFRKVLALDPDHEDARRYLGYAQRAPAEVEDRFRHLE